MDIPQWKITLWNAIHDWCAGLGTKAHQNLKKERVVHGIIGQAKAVSIVEGVVEGAVLAERERVVIWLKSCAASLIAAGDEKYAAFLEEFWVGIQNGEHLDLLRQDDHDTTSPSITSSPATDELRDE